MIWKLVLFLVAVSALKSNGLKLPSYMRPCSLTDPEKFRKCATEVGQNSIPHFAKGDRKYKIPPIEPLVIPKLDINQGPNLKINLKDVKMVGLSKTKIKSVKIDWGKRTSTAEIFIPEITCTAQYNISGRILILPLTGAGDCTINIGNMNGKYKYFFEVYKKTPNGEYFTRPFFGNTTYTVSKLYVHFDNLFNGNRLLGDQTNLFLRENWQEVNKELGPAVAEALTRVLHTIIENVSELVPLKEIFADAPPMDEH